MNDMSAPFTSCPKSELAYWRADDRVECRVGRFPLRSEFASSPQSREYPVRNACGDYRGSYAVLVTVAVTLLSVARPTRREKD